MNNLNAIISSLIPVAAASGATSYFTSVQNKVVSFLNSCLPFVWIIVALALIGVGLMCIIGSEVKRQLNLRLYMLLSVAVLYSVQCILPRVLQIYLRWATLQSAKSRKYILKFDVRLLL